MPICDEDHLGNPKYRVPLGCIFVILIITSVILFVTSWGYVGELQYCFSYSRITHELGTKIEEPGSYLISFGNGFLDVFAVTNVSKHSN